jgi:hypothetical protein
VWRFRLVSVFFLTTGAGALALVQAESPSDRTGPRRHGKKRVESYRSVIECGLEVQKGNTVQRVRTRYCEFFGREVEVFSVRRAATAAARSESS